ncbi:hypothetical protein AN958_06388 [Leucoagaricus sp. SymC.cos]|nr:hypothetical protein AN958_06388 [Leucoagaricus sp. SymC.cos]
MLFSECSQLSSLYSKGLITVYIVMGPNCQEPCSMDQAALLLCMLKKDSQLRTIKDARFRNDNTIKDITPLPDQEAT